MYGGITWAGVLEQITDWMSDDLVVGIMAFVLGTMLAAFAVRWLINTVRG